MWLWIVTVSLVSAILIATTSSGVSVHPSPISLHAEQVFLTLGFVFCSIIMSGGHSEGVGHPEGLCRPNLKLEVLATLCWLGMAALLTYVGVRSQHTKKQYDAKAIVVICFASLEV